MNKLKRDIIRGELVVIDKEYLVSSHQDFLSRVVIATDGFGLRNFTNGQALYVTWLVDCTNSRVEGNMLNKPETEALRERILSLPLNEQSYRDLLSELLSPVWCEAILNAYDELFTMPERIAS